MSASSSHQAPPAEEHGGAAVHDPGAAFIAELAGAGAEKLAPPPRGRHYGGILMLVAVALAAAAVLGAMRWLGQGGKLALLNVKIDYPLDQKKASNADHAAVLEQLRSSETVVQVPLDQIQMNPFMWNGFTDAKSQRDSGPDPAAQQAELSRRAAEQRRQMMQSTLSKLKVNSILGGSIPMARLSGALVRVGDRVADIFTVVSISGRAVVLEADGESFTLNLGD